MYEELIQRLREAGETLDAMADFVVFPNLGMLANLMNEAVDAIEVLSKTEKTTRWIPVAERLPEQNGKYLAFALKEENTMDFYDGHWMLYGIDYRRYVTYWMRIPEPPKEET